MALAIAARVLVQVAATWSGQHVPRYEAALPGAWDRGEVWARSFARWDSAYYMGIAEAGRGAQTGSWAFSPAYPLAVRFVDERLGVDVVTAGVLVSLAAFLACVPLCYHLSAAWFGRDAAWRATALLVFLPSSFYLSAVYSEGLFLAVVLGFFLCVTRGWWLAAGALASLGAVTRQVGILLPAVLLLALLLARARGHRIPAHALIALPLALALPALDAWHAHQETGDWLAQIHARDAVWPEVEWRWPWAVVTLWAHWTQKVAMLLAAGLVGAGLVWAWRDARRRDLDAPLEVYAYCAFLAFIAFCYSDLGAALRYVVPILIVPWALAAWTAPPRRFALVAAASAMLLLATAVLFAAWYPLY